MKRLIALLIMVSSLTIFSPSVLALEATGAIEELKQCRTGGPWKLLMFKVSGNWFALYSDYYSHANNGIHDHVASSMILQAFAAGYTVKVKGNGGWNSTNSSCGEATGQVIHQNKGDYIQLIKNT